MWAEVCAGVQVCKCRGVCYEACVTRVLKVMRVSMILFLEFVSNHVKLAVSKSTKHEHHMQHMQRVQCPLSTVMQTA